MIFSELAKLHGHTSYSIAKATGLPKTTVVDIYSGKRALMNCSGRTLLALSRLFKITIEDLLKIEQKDAMSSVEELLPSFLQESIRKYNEARTNKKSYASDYLMEISSSINVAEVEGFITHECATALRRGYLGYSEE